MRRLIWTVAIIMCFTFVLSACGTKDAESVVKELDKVANNLESYQGSGTMTLHTGQQPLEYQVEVSYQQPQYYRIKLTNEEKDITQIVLRNDEGVFVLTPKLNKVFRFQSDWPQNQGQVYLYQTLIQSIIVDGSRSFAVNDDAYVFDVMANYNNNSLARQKIWLNKSDLSPVQVEVSDTNASVLVDVKFDTFKFGQKFERSVFETEANMNATPSTSGEQGNEPTIATPEGEAGTDGAVTPDDKAVEGDDSAVDGEEQPSGTEEEATTPDDDASTGVDGEKSEDFVVLGPTYFPEGVSQKDATDIVYSGSPGQITRYDGTYSYTLIQTEPKDQAASLTPGLIVDLGITMGELTSSETDALQTLTWTYHGNQFRLTSDNLPESEMIKVAQSVQGEMDK
ncbi:outer membrane lipoprotein carrier protein LolA [Paenibacillus sp. GSMTC-2017]|uniref:LolA family protein n=1 Tax=Paenibacillus sp. GSMTC-2017 TaxID=2794350 RepID=UPI0018D8CAD9|nr:outer membrane lipoprotein carrier protein LolA [Paenibacillus sp. GSMTC-2017]MBH5320144.1 outer membrane lipoprotein carrier protein LolA [Paenibacillus sp. GSMTC-2017]